MKIQVAVFWIMTPCRSDVVGYETFRRAMLPPSSHCKCRNSQDHHQFVSKMSLEHFNRISAFLLYRFTDILLLNRTKQGQCEQHFQGTFLAGGQPPL
jgi:hypothetical protein